MPAYICEYPRTSLDISILTESRYGMNVSTDTDPANLNSLLPAYSTENPGEKGFGSEAGSRGIYDGIPRRMLKD